MKRTLSDIAWELFLSSMTSGVQEAICALDDYSEICDTIVAETLSEVDS